MRVNYHTHTPLCGHAIGNHTSEYADAAFEQGIEILGFSDHAPFPDHDFGCRMLYETLPIYFEQVEEQMEKYAGRMKILKGLEIEYLPEYAKGNNYYEYLLTKSNCDYLLLGEHFFKTGFDETVNMYDITEQEYVLDYAKCCAKAMQTGYFNIVAHPDLFGVTPFRWNETFERATDIIIDAAVKTDTILELNANGFRRGMKNHGGEERLLYPLDPFWEKVKDAKVRVVIGSDSHNPAEIIDGAIEKAEEYLKKLNITPIEIL